MQPPTVTVNGTPRSLERVSPHTTVLDWLRGLGLTGCKEGCAEGECGACSVMVARPRADGASGTEWTALNACLVAAAGFDGQELVTSEGLGTASSLHPVQREMAVRGGSQCGYCTPGFVCSMAAEYYRADRTPTPSHEARLGANEARLGPHEARLGGDGDKHEHEHGPNGFDLHALSGNLCRCTGYRPIRDAAYALTEPADDDELARRRTAPAPAPRPTRLEHDAGRFVRPADLAETLELVAEHPGAQLVAGSTDWGVEVNLRGRRADLTVAVDRLPELREFEIGDDRIRIGAALTLTEAERLLAGRVPLLDEMFPQFASRLIRNGATIGGNLGTASPIGDTPPALLALDATVVLVSADGDREVPLSEYYTGYRQSVRRPDELIRAVLVPLPVPPITAFHKIAKRRFDDISSVAVGFALTVDDGLVRQARIGLGGVAATPIRATGTEQALTGRPWTAETVRQAAEVLGREGTPLDDHRASAAYRSAMLRRSLEKLHAESQPEQEATA
jgi:xanthine dehydrogenase small subunit